MGLIQRLFEAFRPSLPAETPSPFIEAAGVTLDEDMTGWRRLTGNTLRDLDPLTQSRMQELAVYVWRTNPLANRLIELPVAYLLAEGVRVTVADEEAQGWLDAFWNDPINNMEIKLPNKVRELAIYGEQCWPVFVNEFNGHVRLGYLDPGMIQEVITDPDNLEQAIGVVTKRDNRGQYRRYRIIVNGPESVFSKRTQGIRATFSDGECFYFTVNALSNASRGHSDLLPMLDWLDAYDHALFGEVERWDIMRAVIWDVTLKGATPEEVKKRAREISTPKPNTVRVHNDSESWESVTASLGSFEGANSARLLRNHILSGGTIPEHWFGGGGDVNRATAGEMGEPTVKVFTMRQTYLGYILAALATFQIRKRLAVTLGDDALQVFEHDESYEPMVEFPELTARDTSKFATAFNQVVTGVVVAVDRGMLSEQSAVALIAMLAAQIGKDIDPESELEAARADAARRLEADGQFPNYPDPVQTPPDKP